MKYVIIGKIVNTHGLKGEIRILSQFKYKEKVFIPGMKIYIGKDKICETITTYRHHKIFEMITMDGYDDIDQVLKYKGEYVFVNKEDIKLNKNEYLDEDIIGLNAYVDDKLIGIVQKIEDHNGNYILLIKNDQKTFLIPYNFDIISNINLETKAMIINNIPGLFN